MLQMQLARTLEQEMKQIRVFLAQYLDGGAQDGAAGQILQEAAANSGKQLRPRLLLLAAAFGQECQSNSSRLCKLGALVEMIHLASLIHDDIVDDSPLRRGKPTVQSKYGKDMAVYAGDLILSRILLHLLREDLKESGIILAKTVEQMCRGEIGQYACRFQEETSIELYFQNIYGKTAAMFATACRIGAMEGGCTRKTVEILEKIGEKLGYIFQLQDDLLDFASDEAQEGKPVHADFKEGMYTLPVLYTLNQPQQGNLLRRFVQKGRMGILTKSDVQEMELLVRHSGGICYTYARLEEYAAEAKKLLHSLPSCEASAMLLELIQRLAANHSASIAV